MKLIFIYVNVTTYGLNDYLPCSICQSWKLMEWECVLLLFDTPAHTVARH